MDPLGVSSVADTPGVNADIVAEGIRSFLVSERRRVR